MANMYLIYLQQSVMQSAKSRVKFGGVRGGSKSADTLAATAKPSKCRSAPLQRSLLERDECDEKKKKKGRPPPPDLNLALGEASEALRTQADAVSNYLDRKLGQGSWMSLVVTSRGSARSALFWRSSSSGRIQPHLVSSSVGVVSRRRSHVVLTEMEKRSQIWEEICRGGKKQIGIHMYF